MRVLEKRRVVPLAILLALAAAYASARAALAARVWHLELVEYPIALVVAGALLWIALRPERPPRPAGRGRAAAPPPAWRRHQQVVRVLPDPETAPLEAELRAWIESGRAPSDPRLADVLSRTDASSRRKREAFLLHFTRRSPPGA